MNKRTTNKPSNWMSLTSKVNGIFKGDFVSTSLPLQNAYISHCSFVVIWVTDAAKGQPIKEAHNIRDLDTRIWQK